MSSHPARLKDQPPSSPVRPAPLNYPVSYPLIKYIHSEPSNDPVSNFNMPSNNPDKKRRLKDTLERLEEDVEGQGNQGGQ